MKLALRLLALALLLSTATPSGADFTTITQNQGSRFTSALDWTAPGIDLLVPAGALRGSVTLRAEASDAHSGIASVAFQIREWGSDHWTDLCVHGSSGLSATGAFECVLDTSASQDGAYELRAVAVDLEGNAQSSAVADRVLDNTAPTVTLADPGSPLHGSITLSATASDATSGVATVRFYAAAIGTGSRTQLCAATDTPYSCELDTTTLADGRYDFRAVATDAAGNEAESVVTDRLVANGGPSAVLQSPEAFVRGAVTLVAEVTDSGTGIASVQIERAPAGSTTWTTICTFTSAPFACSWDTTGPPDAAYELRAIAVDGNGRSATSTPVSATVDNTAPAVTMNDPGSLTGTVTLSATASDALSGLASVAIQYSPTGTGSWVTVCTAAAPPWACSFDTTTVTAGMYEFRAVATDVAGNVGQSAIVQSQVGTSAPAGPTFGGVGPVATRSSSGSATVQYPAGTTSGDLLFLVQANAADQAITTPTGWTLLADQRSGSPQQFRFTVWWKRAGTESSVPVSTNTNSNGTSLWVVRYAMPAGATPVAPAHTAVRQGVAGAVSTITPSPNVTTTEAATVISIAAVRAPNTLSLQIAQSFGLQASATSSGAGSVHPTIGIADTSAAAGATPASPTWAQVGTAAQWAWATVAFR